MQLTTSCTLKMLTYVLRCPPSVVRVYGVCFVVRREEGFVFSFTAVVVVVAATVPFGPWGRGRCPTRVNYRLELNP